MDFRNFHLTQVRDWLSERFAIANSSDSATQADDSATVSRTSSRASLAIICAVVFGIALGVRLLYWQDALTEIARRFDDSSAGRILPRRSPENDRAGRYAVSE